MGGKRPQQIRKDLQATDFKSRTDDERINEEDKQALQAGRGRERIPRKGANPAREQLKRDSGRDAEES